MLLGTQPDPLSPHPHLPLRLHDLLDKVLQQHVIDSALLSGQLFLRHWYSGSGLSKAGT